MATRRVKPTRRFQIEKREDDNKERPSIPLALLSLTHRIVRNGNRCPYDPGRHKRTPKVIGVEIVNRTLLPIRDRARTRTIGTETGFDGRQSLGLIPLTVQNRGGDTRHERRT
jgi:hypothetical protein